MSTKAKGARGGTGRRHGSIAKAGKVRGQSQKIVWREGRKSNTGLPFHGKKRKSPRMRNRARYHIATMCPACGGTIPVGASKCYKCQARLEHKGLRPVVKRRGGRIE